ncbi:MAG: methyltransferase domain-containing protein [Deltaproteobacteria bacterium]|nr:methyltransferase domain-containing protein [Deltaproteobacteria bacterium]
MNSDYNLKKISSFQNNLYYFIGLSFLFLNKTRHSLAGYRTPRTFPVTQTQRAIEYDINVVDNWMSYLRNYTDGKVSIEGKNILELGPGADLGAGLITLQRGAEKYNAIDVNNLIRSVPEGFYNGLFSRIASVSEGNKANIEYLRNQLTLTQSGKNDRLNYICDKDFDLTVLDGENIDLVFSQAAFEHFDNMDKSLSQLSRIVRDGAVLIAVVDLSTHTRWLREIDPLNIYRFNDPVYNLMRFKGTPNRMRPSAYKRILEDNGWGNVKIIPIRKLQGEYLPSVNGSLNGQFRDLSNSMDYLSILLCADKIPSK